MTYNNKAFILLGANINPREIYIKEAENQISTLIGTIVKKSSVYETESWGFESDNNFFNEVLEIETDLSAITLLNKLLEIENLLGRKRNNEEGYASRTLDADILYFNDEVIEESDLSIPHPRLQLRRFVLEPLCEIAADFAHPVLKVSNKVLLERCNDASMVVKRNYDEL